MKTKDVTRRIFSFPLVPELLSLLVLGVTLPTDYLGYASDSEFSVVPSVLTAILTLLLGHTVATRIQLRDVSGLSERVSEAVKNYLHVTRIGSATDALEYITSRLPSLSEVRGTMLNFDDEGEMADDRLYDSAQYAQFESAIPQAVAKGLRWKDIGDPETGKRLAKIRDICKHHAPPRHDRKYRFRTIESRFPQMNFSLLTYQNGDIELLFNWDYRDIGRDPIVLLSRDDIMVNLFSVHFELLWKLAEPGQESSATRSTSQI